MDRLRKTNIVIVEDDPQQAEALCAMLAEYPEAASFSVHTVAPLEFASLKVDSVDILFMDIRFGDATFSGIDLVKRCISPSYPTQVIYVTGFPEYCTPAYETEHTYFLLKPIDLDAFAKALDKALANIEERLSCPLALRVDGSVVRFQPDEICYVESLRRKALVYTVDGSHEVYAALTKLAAYLPHSFAQCHKSYIVNFQHVAEYTGSQFVMDDGRAIPIAQKRRHAIRRSFFDFMADRACV